MLQLLIYVETKSTHIIFINNFAYQDQGYYIHCTLFASSASESSVPYVPYSFSLETGISSCTEVVSGGITTPISIKLVRLGPVTYAGS